MPEQFLIHGLQATRRGNSGFAMAHGSLLAARIQFGRLQHELSTQQKKNILKKIVRLQGRVVAMRHAAAVSLTA